MNIFRTLIFGSLLFVLSVRGDNVRYCTGDLVLVNVSGLTSKSVDPKHPQLFARVRLVLRPNRTVSKATVEQSSGVAAVDRSLVEQFSHWNLRKATNCDVVIIPVRATIQ